MSYRTTAPAMPIAAALTLAVMALPAAAVQSTSQGLISVAQVNQMLEKAQADGTARQVLTAYLAGVGEAVGASVRGAACQAPFSLNTENVHQALKAASGLDAAQTPATSLIVKDMLRRAGCKGG